METIARRAVMLDPDYDLKGPIDPETGVLDASIYAAILNGENIPPAAQRKAGQAPTVEPAKKKGSRKRLPKGE